MPLARLQPRSLWVAAFLMACLWALSATSAFAAQPVGEVAYAHGIASAQRPGEGPRFVTKGDILNEGDVVTTSIRGFAVIGLKDGTKVTLRPDTSFVIEKYSDAAGQESGLFSLNRGGIRALTGMMAKRKPRSVQFKTAAGAMEIKGTSFDARICGDDCADDARAIAKRNAAQDVVARVAVFAGPSAAIGRDGKPRVITVGMPLVNGEAVRTEKGAYVVLAFRDETKVTVISESEFKLQDVRFAGPKADTGNFVVRIVRGGARALTGLLAKRDPKAVRVDMLTSTIGIRGTGFDAKLAPDCISGKCSEAAFAHTWEGVIALEVGGRSIVIETGRAGVFNPAQDRLTLLDRIPQFFLDEAAPRPDGVKVDFNALFGLTGAEAFPHGLYVSLREGSMEFLGRLGSITLETGESGFLGEDQGTPVRLTRTPPFLEQDPYPAPESFDEQTIRLLEILNPGGSPGDLICEL
jgi:hypothetical protein